jgi:hypothetical protein
MRCLFETEPASKIPGSARDSRAVCGDSPQTPFDDTKRNSPVKSLTAVRRVAERSIRVACAPRNFTIITLWIH